MKPRPLSVRIARWFRRREYGYSVLDIAKTMRCNKYSASGALGYLVKLGFLSSQKTVDGLLWYWNPDADAQTLIGVYRPSKRKPPIAKITPPTASASATEKHPYAYYQLPREERRRREGRPVVW